MANNNVVDTINSIDKPLVFGGMCIDIMLM